MGGVFGLGQIDGYSAECILVLSDIGDGAGVLVIADVVDGFKGMTFFFVYDDAHLFLVLREHNHLVVGCE